MQSDFPFSLTDNTTTLLISYRLVFLVMLDLKNIIVSPAIPHLCQNNTFYKGEYEAFSNLQKAYII